MRMLPLKRVARINSRTLPETTDPDESFRYVDISAVGRGQLVQEPVEVTFGESPSRARRLVEPGDTIVSTVRTYLGAVMHIRDAENLVVSTGFAVVSPRDVHSRFLAWVLESEPFISEVVARSVGVSYPAISPEELAAIQVPLPACHLQRAIADFLDAETARLDSLVTRRHRSLHLLISRDLSVIGRLISATRGPITPVRHLVSRIEQGWSPQCEERQAEPNEWGVLKTGCMNWGRFRPFEHKALPTDVKPRLDLAIADGDILMSRANTRELVGHVGRVTDLGDRRLLLCDKLFRLVPDEDVVDPNYLAFGLRSPFARSAIEPEADGASGSMVNIGQDTIRNLLLPVPSLKIQGQIVEDITRELKLARRTRNAIKRQIALLQERRQALITAAVTGQISIPGIAA